jgi:hypothetical protein
VFSNHVLPLGVELADALRGLAVNPAARLNDAER